ncbi:MAG: biopolymer transporter ExbD [Bacteroidota bacterium]
MPKVKIPRKSTAVDMTAMCDVAFLLLTFFMLTSNFTSKEPIQISTPSSISEIKIPETNILTLLIDKNGNVFFGIDNKDKRIQLLGLMGDLYKTTFTKEEQRIFGAINSFGVPMSKLKEFLNLPPENRDSKDNAIGIPCDSVDNQLKDWVKNARTVNQDLKIAIKADGATPYPVIKKVMNTLQDLRENKYNLITSLEQNPEETK